MAFDRCLIKDYLLTYLLNFARLCNASIDKNACEISPHDLCARLIVFAADNKADVVGRS